MIMDTTAFYIAINTIILSLGILIGLLIKQKGSNIVIEKDTDSVYNYNPNSNSKNSSNDKAKTVQQIKIDNSKFVSELDISGFSKKYENIGNTSEAKEEIQSSIEKLKKLKKGY